MEELQVVRSERDRAVREEKTLRQSLSLLEQETEVWCGILLYTCNLCLHFLSYFQYYCLPSIFGIKGL